MEFWPKKQRNAEKKLVLDNTFTPATPADVWLPPDHTKESKQPLTLDSTFEPEDTIDSPEVARKELDQISTPEEFIQAVDFGELNTIFDTLARKSGKQEADEWIGREQVVIDNSMGVAGMADPLQKQVYISWNEVIRVASDSSPAGVRALQTLTHEMTHLRARLSILDASSAEFDTGSRIHFHSGFGDVAVQSLDQPNKLLAVSLNEAVTEEIARRVFAEYLVRKGMSRYSEDAELGVYANDRMVLSFVITALSESLSIDRDTVWNAFVQGYMNGEQSPREFIKTIAAELEPFADKFPALLLGSKAPLTNQQLDTVATLIGEEKLREIAHSVIARTSIDELADDLKLR